MTDRPRRSAFARAFKGVSTAIGSALLAVLFLGVLLGGLRTAWVLAFPAHPDAPRAEEKERYLASLPARPVAGAPNFIVVFFDDLGYGDLSSYGNRLIETPRIDALAEDGVRLTHFYAAAPVCTPSRAALLTGRHAFRSGSHVQVFFPEGSFVGTLRRVLGLQNEIAADEILLPEALGRAGYATGMVGKWHLGEREGHRPNDLGFDFFYGVQWSNDMLPLHVYRDREIEERDTTELAVSAFGYRHEDMPLARKGVDQATLTARYTDEAIAFIERTQDAPFFLYFSHTFPHVPHFASAEQAGRSRGGLYGDVVVDLDRSVGRLLDALDRLDLAGNTVVVITSDNGPDYGGSAGGLRGRKTESFEGGQRVPFIVRWPAGLPVGVTRDAMASNLDLFPTFLGLAGLPLPEDRKIDGRGLLPVLERNEPTHEHLFYFSGILGGLEAVRGPRLKWLANTGDVGRERPHLTDVTNDPENHDLHERFPEEARSLEAAFEAMKQEIAENRRGWR